MENQPIIPGQRGQGDYQRILALREKSPEVLQAIAKSLWAMVNRAEQDSLIELAVQQFDSENMQAQDDLINERLLLRYLTEPRDSTYWNPRSEP